MSVFNQTSFFTLPETKRVVYYLLEDVIEYSLTKTSDIELAFGQNKIFGIVGPRHSGKTMLLRQLEEKFKNDVFFKTFTDNEDYFTFCQDVSNSKKDIVLIDEICKASFKTQAIFTEAVKDLKNANKIVIYTGSTKEIIKNLANSIGRGIIIDIGLFSYIEYLSWNNGLDDPLKLDISKVIDNSTDDSFKAYLNDMQTLVKIPDYVMMSISDSVISYHNRLGRSTIVNLADKAKKVIRFLSAKQILPVENFYEDIKLSGVLSKDVKDILSQINKQYKSLSSDDTAYIKEILEGCDLLSISRCDVDDSEQYVFNYPGIITEYLKVLLSTISRDDTKALEDIWVEATILNAANKVYDYCGKLRTESSVIDLKTDKHKILEIDLVCKNELGLNIYAIEVKNSPRFRAKDKARNALKLAKSINIPDDKFLFTFSEDLEDSQIDNYNSIPNHLLLIYLEFYYFYLIMATNGLSFMPKLNAENPNKLYVQVLKANELFTKYTLEDYCKDKTLRQKIEKEIRALS